MGKKAFVASTSPVISHFIAQSCLNNGLETIEMRNEANLLQELKQTVPDLIFMQANIIEGADINIVARVKVDENLGHTFLVVTASREDGVAFAHKIGADAFLPVPHTEAQIDAIMRQVFDKPKKILCIRSDSNASAPLFQALTTADFALVTATSGEAGIREAQSGVPDLILCELELSDKKGYDVCRQIKASIMLNHIPLLILSERTDAETLEKCFEAGVHQILHPPYDSEENVQIILSIATFHRRGKKLKALVVDDSPLIRELVSRMFKQIGFFALTAENGSEAFTIASREIPNIIVTDYEMPIMNGYDFCLKLQENEETKTIPVVMVTARGADKDRRLAKSLGLSAYLTKPFSIEDLERRVTHALVTERRTDSRKSSSPKPVQTDRMEEKIPQKKFVTILYSDIDSFVLNCEKYDAGKIVGLLNSYFELMTKILQENRGMIDQLNSQCIVARFDGGDSKTDVMNAIRAAFAMLESLVKFNENLLEEIHVRIGIHSGTVILGHVGARAHRFDYRMFGSHVQIARRIERHAPRMGCMISAAAYELVSGSVEVEAAPKIVMKEIREEISVYKLLKMK
ncbi:MAG: adenylate/guanylate cyclase domain-containing response regulator [Candidatus Omnitrophota bacterium]|jgi:DNA-binding response OmpR family regulator|nr:MAG: adenylate/guanylate cyclase domain-containing response regulator [Candidatus Omnitrophota bacterium]